MPKPTVPARSSRQPAAAPTASYPIGYPRHSPLLRGLLPIALAILLFLNYGFP